MYDTRNQEEEKMRKNVKKVIAPLLAAAMALSCTVCVSAAEDETIKLTVCMGRRGRSEFIKRTDRQIPGEVCRSEIRHPDRCRI